MIFIRIKQQSLCLATAVFLFFGLSCNESNSANQTVAMNLGDTFKLAITVPTKVTAGVPFNATVTINNITDVAQPYKGHLSFSTNDRSSLVVVPNPFVIDVPASTGQVVKTNFIFTLGTVQENKITVSDSVLGISSSVPITVEEMSLNAGASGSGASGSGASGSGASGSGASGSGASGSGASGSSTSGSGTSGSGTSGSGTSGSGESYHAPQGFTRQHSFAGGSGGESPSGSLIFGADGRLYGVTEGGGTNNHGTIFRVATDGSSYSVLYSFAGGTAGSHPTGSLLLGTDGKLYGTTTQGGVDGVGTIFRVATDGSSYSVLYSFTVRTDGCIPSGGLILGTDGKLYGMASFCGTNDKGTVFSIATDGSAYSRLYSFNAGNLR